MSMGPTHAHTDKSTVVSHCFGLASLPDRPGHPSFYVSFFIHAKKVVTLQNTSVAQYCLSNGSSPLLCFCLLLYGLHTKCICSDPTGSFGFEVVKGSTAEFPLHKY